MFSSRRIGVCWLALLISSSLCLCASVVSPLHANPPVASYLFPAGGRRGTTVNARVGGLYLYKNCSFELIGPGVEASKQLRSASRHVVRGTAAAVAGLPARGRLSARPGRRVPHRRRCPAGHTTRPALDRGGRGGRLALRRRRSTRDRRERNRWRSDPRGRDSARDDQRPYLSARGRGRLGVRRAQGPAHRGRGGRRKYRFAARLPPRSVRSPRSQDRGK